MVDYSKAEEFLLNKYEVEDLMELEHEYYPSDVISVLVNENFGTRVECADFWDEYIAFIEYSNSDTEEIIEDYLSQYELTPEDIFKTWLDFGNILYVMSKNQEIYHKLIDPLISLYDVKDLEEKTMIEDDFNREIYKSLDHKIDKIKFLIKNGTIETYFM